MSDTPIVEKIRIIRHPDYVDAYLDLSIAVAINNWKKRLAYAKWTVTDVTYEVEGSPVHGIDGYYHIWVVLRAFVEEDWCSRIISSPLARS